MTLMHLSINILRYLYQKIGGFLGINMKISIVFHNLKCLCTECTNVKMFIWLINLWSILKYWSIIY